MARMTTSFRNNRLSTARKAPGLTKAMRDLLLPLKPAIRQQAEELRSNLLKAAQENKVNFVESTFVAERRRFDTKQETIIYYALYEPSPLLDFLPENLHGTESAVFYIEAEYQALQQRLRDEVHERGERTALQKGNIEEVIRTFLSAVDRDDAELVKKAREKLAYYRRFNPYGFEHKKSFVEMLAIGEWGKKSWPAILEDVSQEWAPPEKKRKFTIEKLVSHFLQKAEEEGLTLSEHATRRMSAWIRNGLIAIQLRNVGMEVVCAATGMNREDEAMMWRLARGDAYIQIGIDDAPGVLFDKLSQKAGIPPVRLYPMLDIDEDAASDIREEKKHLAWPQAMGLLECAQPTKSWFTGKVDRQKFDQHHRLAGRLSDRSGLVFDDIIDVVVKLERPHKALMDSVVGARGLRPTSTEELQQLWSHCNGEVYGFDRAAYLKFQNESKERALTEDEAQVILGLAKQAYPFISLTAEEAGIEILTRLPSAEKLIDRFNNQADDNKQTGAVSLKETLECIARRKGKVLEAKDRNNQLIYELNNSQLKLLRKEDRLGRKTAILFAETLKLADERRRKFLVRAQGYALINPDDIIDGVQGEAMSPKEGIKGLIIQAAHDQKSFAKHIGLNLKTLVFGISVGRIVHQRFAPELADELGRPDLVGRIARTFCGDKTGHEDKLKRPEKSGGTPSCHELPVI